MPLAGSENEGEAAIEFRCVLCNAVLPPGVEICEKCSPPAARRDPRGKRVEALLDKASALLFAGFGFLPLVLAPLAFQTVLKAEGELAALGLADAALAARARRLRYSTMVASIVVYGLVAWVSWSLLTR